MTKVCLFLFAVLTVLAVLPSINGRRDRKSECSSDKQCAEGQKCVMRGRGLPRRGRGRGDCSSGEQGERCNRRSPCKPGIRCQPNGVCSRRSTTSTTEGASTDDISTDNPTSSTDSVSSDGPDSSTEDSSTDGVSSDSPASSTDDSSTDGVSSDNPASSTDDSSTDGVSSDSPASSTEDSSTDGVSSDSPASSNEDTSANPE